MSIRFASLVLAPLVLIVSPVNAVTLCGLLDGPGCVPAACSVFDSRPCLPDNDNPIGGNLRLTIDSRSAADESKPERDLNTIRELFFALRACWMPPAEADARAGMQMTMRVSFKRSGEMISAPRLTYALPGASRETRDVYRKAIAQSLSGCAPLHFTKGLAGAIAGRPIMIRYIDNREIGGKTKQ